MKVFELTEANIKTDFVKFAKKLVQKGQSIKATSSGTPSGKLDGKDGANQAASSGTPSGKLDGKDTNSRTMIDAATAKILSGEAKLSKDADAELGKRGADPQDVHIKIVSKQQDASQKLAAQINKATGRTGRSASLTYDRADLMVNQALFGYINKKYLGGDDINFSGNTMDIITKALKSQAPKGSNQPIGKVSSSRAPGAQGTVSSGGGTNALDTIAAQDDW